MVALINFEVAMPAIGQETNTIFYERDIFDPTKYGEMKSEPLSLKGDTDAIVVPVRKVGSPHFRALSTIKQTRVGSAEDNKSHSDTIEMLLRKFQGKRLKLLTYIFDEKSNKSEQVLFDTKVDYQWWCDSDATKISFGDGKYIRPDLCGRDNKIFSANRASRSIVIEVVNSHIPEHETLCRLRELSEKNHIILFYYISDSRKSSQFNNFKCLDKYIELRISFCIIDGKFFKNGEEVSQLTGQDVAWYNNIKSRFFDYPLTQKK